MAKKKPMMMQWNIIKKVGRNWELWDSAPNEQKLNEMFHDWYLDGDGGVFKMTRSDVYEVKPKKAKKK